MNLQQLEYIVAVDKHRHFQRAADECCVTQATLSMMIKKLEEELEVILFDRSKQPVVPTETGKGIIKQAKLILKEK
jgi:LysR family hydrogen peroxide-inducible transcriptional activator